jgi:FdhD protein
MKESGIGSQKIIRRKRDGELEYLPDDLTIEEPLEIRVGRKPIATTMRTPGHDEELAAGFLLSEGIVRVRDQIASVSVIRDNRVDVELTAGVKLKLNSMERFGTISSSCGLCGKTSIDAIRQNFPAVGSTDIRIDIETLLSLPETLRNAQAEFMPPGFSLSMANSKSRARILVATTRWIKQSAALFSTSCYPWTDIFF